MILVLPEGFVARYAIQTEDIMSSQAEPDTVVQFPKGLKPGPSTFEQIWGKSVASHGYVAVPGILVRAQRRLGLNSTQMNIIVQLLDYWRRPEWKPWPTKQQLADRLGVSPKAIQVNMRALERHGLLRREAQKTASGDYGSNIYHLDPLVERLKTLEPEFQAAREDRERAVKSARAAEVPAGRRAVLTRGGPGR